MERKWSDMSKILKIKLSQPGIKNHRYGNKLSLKLISFTCTYSFLSLSSNSFRFEVPSKGCVSPNSQLGETVSMAILSWRLVSRLQVTMILHQTCALKLFSAVTGLSFTNKTSDWKKLAALLTTGNPT